MKITHLRVNHLENPIGYDVTHPVFSFVIGESTGKKLQSARIRVSENADMNAPCYDSGARADINGLAFTPEKTFAGGVRYYWNVEAVADDGDCGVSSVATFEGGTAAREWEAPFIASPWDESKPPVFVRDFAVRTDAPVASARLYICGLGLYEAYVNGEKVGDEYLAPYCNDYRFAIQYQTLDVTAMLRPGENTLRVPVGAGWYMGRFTYLEEGKLNHIGGDRFLLTARLEVRYADGTTDALVTDERWRCVPSPVLESNIYDGEVYDARLEDESETVQAILAKAPKAPLVERFSPPLRLHESFAPQLIITPRGEQVLDFGQEMSGWVEFDCDLPAGERVTLHYSEIMQDACFYRDNLRTAKAEFTYVSAGHAAHVRPHFTFYGFRYVMVTGVTLTQENLAEYGFTARAMYSDLARTGRIETDNAKINRLIENTIWGQKSNFVDVPTDCPQRDERLGWTGDAQVFCATASYHMYTPAFYRKYLRDMLEAQRINQGSVSNVVPDFLAAGREKMGKPPFPIPCETWGENGSCAWGDAATVIPATMYTFYGDKALLAETYENMKRWTDYIIWLDETHCGGARLWQCSFHFADWLALDNPEKTSLGRTESYYVASVYYLYSARLTAQAARALGKEDDAAYYQKIADEVLAALRHEYITPAGRVGIDTQTALVLALAFDILEPQHRERAARDLHKALEKQRMHLNTGFVGTAYLCHTLTKAGLTADAYTLLLNEDYPSWLYEVNLGATTIWERWNSLLPDGHISSTGMNSLNHYAYGAVAEWIYRDVCGLTPAPESAGFARIDYTPHPDKRLGAIRASYDSASGRYESAWKWEGDLVRAELTVPFGCTAKLGVPAGFALRRVDGNAADTDMTLEPGKHEIVFAQL